MEADSRYERIKGETVSDNNVHGTVFCCELRLHYDVMPVPASQIDGVIKLKTQKIYLYKGDQTTWKPLEEI
jgi:hypothetical protein